MKTLRFTGHIKGEYVDVRFTTDMIGDTDTNFNITQIQEGPDFSTTDKQKGTYQKYFSTTFQETNNTLSTAKQFATDQGLGLRLYDAVGNHTNLVNDGSISASH